MLRCLGTVKGEDDDDDYESWETTDLPHALVLLGPDVAEQLMEFAADARQSCTARVTVLESIKDLGEQHPAIAQSLSPRIVAVLENAAENPVLVNTDLMGLAIDWKRPEAAEVIERAFSMNKIDCGCFGDWDAVRRELHVEGIGLAMPERPFNSLDDFRRKVGIGCFSKEMLFNMDEFDDQAVENYLNEACRAFSVSPEGKQVLGEDIPASNVHLFLDLAIHYCVVTVDTMTIADAKEVLLEIFPRKVSMDAEHCEEVITELAAFWRFVDRVHGLDHTNEIAKTVTALSNRFREAMTDRSNFGMAKSMFMIGDEAGFDMTTQEGLDELIGTYNGSLLAAHQPEPSVPTPASAEQKRADRKNRKKLLAAKTKSKKKR
jgi:hypothetical protein